MEDYMPQDEYFEWEDIVAYNAPRGIDEDFANQQDVPFPNFTTSFPVSKPIVLDDGLDEDAWWSDEESNISTTSLSAFPTSHPTFLSLSVTTTTTICQTQIIEPPIIFPEYNSASSCSSLEDLPSDISSQDSQEEDSEDEDEEDEEDLAMSPAGPAPVMMPKRTCDDLEIQKRPLNHVDYFSHSWTLEDVAASWRHLSSRREVYKHHARLENASWRAWTKTRNSLKTVSPKSVNWMKELDDTSLYGPFLVGTCLYPKTAPKATSNLIRYSRFSPIIPSATPLRSVLKKPTMTQILLRGSIPAFYAPNPAPRAAREVVITPPRPIHVPFKKMLARASSFNNATTTSNNLPFPAPLIKKVNFLEEVSQFTAIDFSTIESQPQISRWPRSLRFSNAGHSRSHSQSKLAKIKTIEKLPPTTIRAIKRQRKSLNNSWSKSSSNSSASLIQPDLYEFQDGHPAADLSEWTWLGASDPLSKDSSDREVDLDLDWRSTLGGTPGPRTYLTDLMDRTRSSVSVPTPDSYCSSYPTSDLNTLPSQSPTRKTFLPSYHSNVQILPSNAPPSPRTTAELLALEDVLSAEEQALLEELDMSSMSSMSPDSSDYQSSTEDDCDSEANSGGGFESPDISDQKERGGARGLGLSAKLKGLELESGLGKQESQGGSENLGIPRIAIFEPMGRQTLFERVMDEFSLAM